MRPSGTTRGVPVASADAHQAAFVQQPAMRISATASMMPEPQMPVIPARRCPRRTLPHPTTGRSRSRESAAPWSRGRCGSPRSRRARRAGPTEICAPSKAGPVGDEQARHPAVSPKQDLGIGAHIDDQHQIVGLAGLLAQRDGGGIGAHMAGDTGQDIGARTRVDRAQIQLARVQRDASDVASAKGAWPSSTGSIPSNRWCITGLQTNTVSTIRSGRSRPPWRCPRPER